MNTAKRHQRRRQRNVYTFCNCVRLIFKKYIIMKIMKIQRDISPHVHPGVHPDLKIDITIRLSCFGVSYQMEIYFYVCKLNNYFVLTTF